MISDVSLRLLYLIFQQVLGLVLLHGPHVRHQGRRAARPTARGRRAPPHEPQTPPGLGRPGRVRRARPAAAPSAAPPSPGHPGHDPALASPPRTPEVDLPEPARTPTDRRRARRTGRADGDGQPELGIPEDPGRAAQTRPPGRRLDDPADPQAPPHPTGTGTAHRHQLAAVPAHPGHQHARGRLLPRRLRGHAAAALRLVRARGRRPLPARPGRDRAPGRTVDHAAGPQPRHGPRRTGSAVPVPRPRSGRTVRGARSTRCWRMRASRWSRSRRGVRARTATPNASC